MAADKLSEHPDSISLKDFEKAIHNTEQLEFELIMLASSADSEPPLNFSGYKSVDAIPAEIHLIDNAASVDDTARQDALKTSLKKRGAHDVICQSAEAEARRARYCVRSAQNRTRASVRCGLSRHALNRIAWRSHGRLHRS